MAANSPGPEAAAASPATGTGQHSRAGACYQAAVTAGYAPSVENRQPWRWHVAAGRLDLFLERGRLREVLDAEDRLALMSCGAALHHARLALAAAGWSAGVEPGARLSADHLAGVAVGERIPHDLAVVRLAQVMRRRRTDRRATGGMPPAPADLAAIGEAVATQDFVLDPLTPEQTTALAADRRSPRDATVAQWCAELDEWAVRRGTFAVIHGVGDGLRAGEALSAGWLAATRLGVAVLPLRAPTVDPEAGRSVRSVLDGLVQPFLVIRLARYPDRMARPFTSRLPTRQLISRRPD
jgi:nitroreductase